MDQAQFEQEKLGDSVQVAVKIIKLKRQRVFQYTVLNDCTRLRVLGLTAANSHYSRAFSLVIRLVGSTIFFGTFSPARIFAAISTASRPPVG